MDTREYENLLEKALTLLDNYDWDSDNEYEEDDPRAATCNPSTASEIENDPELMAVVRRLAEERAMYNAIDAGPSAVKTLIVVFIKTGIFWHASYENGDLTKDQDDFLMHAIRKSLRMYDTRKEVLYPEAAALIQYYIDIEIIGDVMDEIIRYLPASDHMKLLIACEDIMEEDEDYFVEVMQGNYRVCPIRSFMFRCHDSAMDVLLEEFGMDLCRKLASPPGPVSGSLLDNLITPINHLYPEVNDDMRALWQFIEFLEAHRDEINMWNVFVYRSARGDDVFKGSFLYKLLTKEVPGIPQGRAPDGGSHTERMALVTRILTLCDHEEHLRDKLIVGFKDTGASALQVAVNMSSVYTGHYLVPLRDVGFYMERFSDIVTILVRSLTRKTLKDVVTTPAETLLNRGDTLLHLAARQPSEAAMRVLFEETDDNILSKALDVRQKDEPRYTPFLVALTESAVVTSYMVESQKINSVQLNADFIDEVDGTVVRTNVESALREDAETPGRHRFMIRQEARDFLLNVRLGERAVKSARI